MAARRLLPFDAISTLLLLVVALVAVMVNATGRVAVTSVAACALAVSSVNAYQAYRTRVDRNVGHFVIHAGVWFWFYLPGFLTSLTADHFRQSAPGISITPRDALLAYVATSLFYATYVLVYRTRLPAIVARIGSAALGGGVDLSTRSIIRLVVLLWLAAMGIYALLAGGPVAAVAEALKGRDATKPWVTGGPFGNEVTPFATLATAFLVVACATALVTVVSRRVAPAQRLVLLAVAAAALAWVAVESGTRSTLLSCVIPPALVYLIKIRGSSPGRRAARLTLLAMLGIAVLVAANAQRSYRSTGDLDRVRVTARVQDNDFLSVTAFSVAIQRAEGSHLQQATPWLLVAGPVPRVLWSGKPVPEAAALTTEYLRGTTFGEGRGNSLPSNVGGEFLNWGWPGVLVLGLATAMITQAGDRFVRTHTSLVGRTGYYGVLAFLFVSFRGFTVGFFLPVLVYVVYLNLLRLRGRSRSTPGPTAPAVTATG
jgi:hypothetical protein